MADGISLTVSEFIASLAVQVRKDEKTNETIDLRDAQARRWSTDLPNNPEIMELLEPHDCAAIFSCCVGIMYPASARLIIAAKSRNRLTTVVSHLEMEGRLPLVARANHPAAQFLSKLLCTDIGRRMYRSITVLLLEVQDDRDARCLLFYPPGRERGDRAPVHQEVNDLDALDADHSTTTEITE